MCAWFLLATLGVTREATPLRSVVKHGQKGVPESTLPLVCLTFAVSPDAGKLTAVVLVRSDTNEEFVADLTSVFLPHPSAFTKEEEPRRALSMLVIHLEAGSYRLKEVQYEGPARSTVSFDLSKPPGFLLNVKANCVNYVGTLVLSTTWQARGLPGQSIRVPSYFTIEDTAAHDRAWAEQVVPGLASVPAVASVLEREREKPAEPLGFGFPVTRQTKLVVTSPIRFLSSPHSFTAEPGVFAPALETDDGVYFAAPGGLQFGNEAHPNRMDGGIFLSKETAKTASPGVYVGTPSTAELSSDPWRNLFMQEGVLWHLEQPTAPKPDCPPNWKAMVDEWAAGVEHGKWRLQDCGDPVYRYSNPSGWLITVVLERTGRVASDEYSRITLFVVIAGEKVSSRMLTSRILETGKLKVVVPLKRPVWEPANK